MVDGPDHLFIGAPKAGTTWASGLINSHSQVCRLPVKELRFLSTNPWGHKGKLDKIELTKKRFGTLTASQELFFQNWLEEPDRREDSWKWYSQLFNRPEGYLAGDHTPANMTAREEDIVRLSKEFPDLRLFFFVRNPIERDFSQIKFTLIQQRKKEPSLDDVEEFLNSPFCRTRSSYTDCFDLWGSYFKDIQLIWYEDIQYNPNSVLNTICKKLGIDAEAKQLDFLHKKVNVSRVSDHDFRLNEDIVNLLKNINKDEISRFSKRFGGYSDNWYKKCFMG